jgi:hypothetical protein
MVAAIQSVHLTELGSCWGNLPIMGSPELWTRRNAVQQLASLNVQCEQRRCACNRSGPQPIRLWLIHETQKEGLRIPAFCGQILRSTHAASVGDNLGANT